MKQKHLLIGAAVLALVIIVGIVLLPSRTEKVPMIVSDDGTAAIIIPKDALPEGVKMKDITITAFPQEEEGVLATYSLEPHGLELEEPVTLTLSVDTEAEGLWNSEKGSFRIPEFFHTAEDGSLRPLEDTKIWFDMETKEMTVDITLRTFSYIQETEGHAEASLILDPWLSKDDSYPVGQDFTAHASVTYIDDTIRRIIPASEDIDPEKYKGVTIEGVSLRDMLLIEVDDRPIGNMDIFKGSYTSNNQAITPFTYLDLPSSEIVARGEIYPVETVDFHCTEPTEDGSIEYSIIFSYDTERSNVKHPSNKKIVHHEDYLVIHAPVRCRGKIEGDTGTLGTPEPSKEDGCSDSWSKKAMKETLRIEPCKEEYVVGDSFTAHSTINYNPRRYNEKYKRKKMSFEYAVGLLRVFDGAFSASSVLKPEKALLKPLSADVILGNSLTSSQEFTCVKGGKVTVSYSAQRAHDMEIRSGPLTAEGKMDVSKVSVRRYQSYFNGENEVKVVCKTAERAKKGTIGQDSDQEEEKPCTSQGISGAMHGHMVLEPCKDEYLVGDSFDAVVTTSYLDGRFDEHYGPKRITFYQTPPEGTMKILSGDFSDKNKILMPWLIFNKPQEAQVPLRGSHTESQTFTCQKPGSTELSYNESSKYDAYYWWGPYPEGGLDDSKMSTHFQSREDKGFGKYGDPLTVPVVCKDVPGKQAGVIGETPDWEPEPCSDIADYGPVRVQIKLVPCKKYYVGDSFVADVSILYKEGRFYESMIGNKMEYGEARDSLQAEADLTAPFFIEPTRLAGIPSETDIPLGSSFVGSASFTCLRPSEGPTPISYKFKGKYSGTLYSGPPNEKGDDIDPEKMGRKEISEKPNTSADVPVECIAVTEDDDKAEGEGEGVLGGPDPVPPPEEEKKDQGQLGESEEGDQGTIGEDDLHPTPPPSPPPIATIIPENGSTFVPVDENILINFSQPMRTLSVVTALHADFAYSLKWNGTSQLIITPENLKLDERYTVTINTLAHDMKGQPLQQSVRSSFKTGEPREEIEEEDYIPQPYVPITPEEEAQPTSEPTPQSPPSEPSSSCTDVCGVDRVYETSNEASCYDTSGSFAQIPNKQPCYNYLVARGWQIDSSCCCQDIIVSLSETCELDRFTGWDANGWAVMNSSHTMYPY